MRKNPFIAIGYWNLLAVNLWLGYYFATLFPDQIPDSLQAEIIPLNFALRMIEILTCVYKNWRTKMLGSSHKKKRSRSIFLSGTLYLMGISLIMWAAPKIWAFLLGHLFLLVGGFQLGRELAKVRELGKEVSPDQDQESS